MFAPSSKIAPKEVIIQAAALRYEHAYAQAVSLIETHIASLSGLYRIQGQLQGFYAANEGGLLEKAYALAVLLHAQDPLIPSVNAFLANGDPRLQVKAAGVAANAPNARSDAAAALVAH